MIRTVTAAALLATLVATSPATSQVPVGVEPGVRVRVTRLLDARTVGVVESAGADTLVLLDERGVRHAVPTEGIRRLERHAGTERRFGHNLLVTSAVSAGIFGVLFAATYEECSGIGCISPESEGGAFVWGVIAGAVIALPVGAVIGMNRRHDVWVDVAAPRTSTGPTLRLQPAPGARVGLVGSIPTRW